MIPLGSFRSDATLFFAFLGLLSPEANPLILPNRLLRVGQTLLSLWYCFAPHSPLLRWSVCHHAAAAWHRATVLWRLSPLISLLQTSGPYQLTLRCLYKEPIFIRDQKVAYQIYATLLSLNQRRFFLGQALPLRFTRSLGQLQSAPLEEGACYQLTVQSLHSAAEKPFASRWALEAYQHHPFLRLEKIGQVVPLGSPSRCARAYYKLQAGARSFYRLWQIPHARGNRALASLRGSSLMGRSAGPTQTLYRFLLLQRKLKKCRASFALKACGQYSLDFFIFLYLFGATRRFSLWSIAFRAAGARWFPSWVRGTPFQALRFTLCLALIYPAWTAQKGFWLALWLQLGGSLFRYVAPWWPHPCLSFKKPFASWIGYYGVWWWIWPMADELLGPTELLAPLSQPLISTLWYHGVFPIFQLEALLSSLSFSPEASLLRWVRRLTRGSLETLAQLTSLTSMLVLSPHQPWTLWCHSLWLVALLLPKDPAPLTPACRPFLLQPLEKLLAFIGALPAYRFTPQISSNCSLLEIFDVGHGQCFMLRKGKEALLFDTAKSGEQGSVASQVVLPYLKKNQIKLQALFISHGDDDHVGGLPDLKRYGGPKVRVIAPFFHPEATQIALEGAHWQWKEWKIEALWPPRGRVSGKNSDSLLLLLRSPLGSLLLPGDLPETSERQLLPSLKKRCVSKAIRKKERFRILQLAHHGSHTSSCYPFLRTYEPTLAVSSQGRRPHAPLPHAEVDARLQALNIPHLGTAQWGKILLPLCQLPLKAQLSPHTLFPPKNTPEFFIKELQARRKKG